MICRLLRSALLGTLSIALVLPSEAYPDSNWMLWYDRPAQKWTEGLPVGNGRLGAMVLGGVARERIQLNEDTVWAGQPVDRDRKGAYKHLAEARRLIFAGRYVEGQRMMQQQFMGERLIRSYQTLGDLILQFPHADHVTDYRRQLDLDSAVARVSYRRGDASFTREIFASAVDQLLVVRLECDRPGQLEFRVQLTRPESYTVRAEENDLIMSGQAVQQDIQGGVKFVTQLRVLHDGGTVTSEDQGLNVRGATAVTLLLAAATVPLLASRRTRTAITAVAQRGCQLKKLRPFLSSASRNAARNWYLALSLNSGRGSTAVAFLVTRAVWSSGSSSAACSG